MTPSAIPPHDLADASLAVAGTGRIAWAQRQMPVLARVRERFASQRPLRGIRVAACLHVTAETASLMRTLKAGGARVALCSANPLSVQDDVAAALVHGDRIEVHAVRGEDPERYREHLRAVLATSPQVTLDDGADLLAALHEQAGGTDGEASTTTADRGGRRGLEGLLGGIEETTGGLALLRSLQQRGLLRCPVLAVNEARTERALNDRHGTGQSALDGIIRASGVLLAGQTLVVVGYGWAGQGIAERARGAGANVIVCEIDPLRALEARMAGYQVMPALDAALLGDVFVTVTGARSVLRAEHFEAMKDGALLANAGHFDVEIDLAALRALAGGDGELVRPLVRSFRMADGRKLHLLAEGRVVNLAAAEGHPAAVMDVSFALQALCVEALVKDGGRMAAGVHPVPEAIDREVAALKLAALGVQIDRPPSPGAQPPGAR